MKLKIAAALLALLPTSAMATQPASTITSQIRAVHGLTDAQKTTIINAAFNQALIILDRAGRHPSAEQRDTLYTAIGQGLERIITRNDMLSLDAADQARSILDEGVKAAISAAGAVVTGDKVGGGALGGGLATDLDVILGSVATDLIAAGASVVGALGAGVAIGMAIDDTYSAVTGSSIGEDIAAGVESVEQAELDAAVAAAQAAKAEAQQQAEEKANAAGEEEKKDGEGSTPPPSDSNSGGGGMPNPEADTGSGSHPDPVTGAAPSVNKPGGGQSDPKDGDTHGDGAIDPATGKPYPVDTGSGNADGGHEHEVHGPLLQQDLVSIIAHGKLPTILTTPDMLARLRAIPGAIP